MPETIVRDGQRIAYTDHGGDGPVVVALHSFLMDGTMFAPQVEAWRGGFRVITVDERGHGDTPADGPFDYWDVARDVLELLDELGIERAAVVGTSQGGFIALRTALLAPDRISALGLLGTSAAPEDPEVAAQYRELAAGWVAHGPADQLIDTVAAICLGTLPAEYWKARWRTVSGEHFDRILGVLVERDGLLERLPEITAPALVLHGSADAAYPVEKARQIADGLPAAEPLVVVEGGAHFLSLTDAASVTGPLTEFLRKHA
ncbi:MAG: alpha/beta hydrolase [Pseudonocardia sp.]|uniref:alpha/beta fold hydrolase n=1 Tax=Pseudonocardia sp. TaxID=60912 RepID=UPI001AD31684|nr:alpha/beta hydrolase [Pseudonocardia sp.]MBN9099288.1 alpha/beta hydrolase [Pseudonocardia sp.]